MRRVVIVICDGLRADMLCEELTPNLWQLRQRATAFERHRSVFPSTTRTTSASIATGCLPGRHGLEGNCVALDEGEGLVALSVGPVAFRDRLERATGRTLRVPTLAEILRDKGEAAVFSNVSPGAAIFQDPDGHGWLYHRNVCHGPGRTALPAEETLSVSHDTAGDDAMTQRFVDEVLQRRRPALALLWQCEPDHTQHDTALGSPRHLEAVRNADRNVGRVVQCLASAPDTDEVLLMVASDHGHETVSEVVDLEAWLVEAGLEEAMDSRELVVASNGFSASIYLAAEARPRSGSLVELLRTAPFVGEVHHADSLRRLGHRVDGALAIVVTGARSDEPNTYGVPGMAVAFRDRLSDDTRTGCGQHGGLGRYEQHPFLLVSGNGFAAGKRHTQPTSAVDLAPTGCAFLGVDAPPMDGRVLG